MGSIQGKEIVYKKKEGSEYCGTHSLSNEKMKKILDEVLSQGDWSERVDIKSLIGSVEKLCKKNPKLFDQSSILAKTQEIRKKLGFQEAVKQEKFQELEMSTFLTNGSTTDESVMSSRSSRSSSSLDFSIEDVDADQIQSKITMLKQVDTEILVSKKVLEEMKKNDSEVEKTKEGLKEDLVKYKELSDHVEKLKSHSLSLEKEIIDLAGDSFTISEHFVMIDSGMSCVL